jgi:hypothetical protein
VVSKQASNSKTGLVTFVPLAARMVTGSMTLVGPPAS